MWHYSSLLSRDRLSSAYAPYDDRVAETPVPISLLSESAMLTVEAYYSTQPIELMRCKSKSKQREEKTSENALDVIEIERMCDRCAPCIPCVLNSAYVRMIPIG